MQFFADHHSVGAVATTATDRLGEVRAQQARLPGTAVQLARQVTAAFPLVDVGQYLPFGKRAYGLAKLVALGCGPDVHDSSLSGTSR